MRKGIKIRNKQIEVMNKVIREECDGKNLVWLRKRYPLVNPETRQIDLLAPQSNDDLLMMNPFLKNRKMYHSEHIRGWWNEILSKCDFKDRFTLYSLRSTHITHALLKGMNIRVIAENCGTSQAEIEFTYKRLNNLLNKDELGFFKDRVEESFVGEG
jgi:integrase